MSETVVTVPANDFYFIKALKSYWLKCCNVLHHAVLKRSSYTLANIKKNFQKLRRRKSWATFLIYRRTAGIFAESSSKPLWTWEWCNFSSYAKWSYAHDNSANYSNRSKMNNLASISAWKFSWLSLYNRLSRFHVHVWHVVVVSHLTH